MAAWRLVDGRDPVDRPDQFPTKAISAESELRQELDRLRQLPSGIVSLIGPAGGSLQIGIGGPFAGVRWYRDPRGSEQIRELLADSRYCSTRLDFRAEGDVISFWPEHLLPVDQLIDVAAYFFNHQQFPDWATWKEWDPSRRMWTIKPAIQVRSA